MPAASRRYKNRGTGLQVRVPKLDVQPFCKEQRYNLHFKDLSGAVPEAELRRVGAGVYDVTLMRASARRDGDVVHLPRDIQRKLNVRLPGSPPPDRAPHAVRVERLSASAATSVLHPMPATAQSQDLPHRDRLVPSSYSNPVSTRPGVCLGPALPCSA